MKVKDLIKEIRFRCDITQMTLSQWTGITQASLSMYEKGDVKIRLNNLKKLIEVANKNAKMKISINDIDLD